MYMHVGAFRGQKRVWGSLDLELQAVLETELRSAVFLTAVPSFQSLPLYFEADSHTELELIASIRLTGHESLLDLPVSVL